MQPFETFSQSLCPCVTEVAIQGALQSKIMPLLCSWRIINPSKHDFFCLLRKKNCKQHYDIIATSAFFESGPKYIILLPSSS